MGWDEAMRSEVPHSGPTAFPVGATIALPAPPRAKPGAADTGWEGPAAERC